MTPPDDRLSLRAWRPDDAEQMLRFRSDPVNAVLTMGRVLVPQTAEQVRQLHADESMYTYLWVDTTGATVGFSVLTEVDHVNGTVHTGSAVFDPTQRGQGLGTLGRRLMLDLLFNELNFRRIYGSFADYNEASRRSHLKMGAEIIGIRRDRFFVSGRYHDAVMYTVSRERFNSLFPPDPDRYLGSRAPRSSPPGPGA